MAVNSPLMTAQMNKLPMRMVAAFLLALLIGGCSNSGRHSPAPVDNVYVKSKTKPGIQYKSVSGKSYQVSKGETLYAIAWRAGLDFRQLAKINNIKKPYQIFPDQIIKLRAPSAASRKSKVRVPTPKLKPGISPRIVAKTLAQQKQGEYGQNNKNKKPLAKPQAAKKKQQSNKQPSKAKSKPYSNKIKTWIWPTTGQLIAGFSSKENGNKGIDIGGKSGTSIVSAADGKVVYYGNALRGYGNLIIIKHNDDYLSAYAHNRRVLVKEKEFVKAGQKIAEMGDTDSQAVKLHFEVRYRGKSVNPMKYLPKR